MSQISLKAKLAKIVRTTFCLRPTKGDHSHALCGFGVAEGSICASNNQSKIYIGPPRANYRATNGMDCLCEIEESRLRQRPVMFDQLITHQTLKEGEGMVDTNMPDVPGQVDALMSKAKVIGHFNPHVLLQIAQNAVIADAMSVCILRPAGKKPDVDDVLLFDFTFLSDGGEQYSLFEGPINARGVVVKPTTPTAGNAEEAGDEPEAGFGTEDE